MHDSAVLLIDCPDRRGLVARVSGLLYEHGANILHADQHQDHEQNLFFMRVEFSLPQRLADSGPSDESPEKLDLPQISSKHSRTRCPSTSRNSAPPSHPSLLSWA
jgi:formyltetrahydrofolate hydrolase